MENASKALLIAGGVLIALLIISLLLLTLNKIGDNKRSESSGTKDSQLASFNRDFERYTEGTINGTDVLSLMNKISDYNKTQADISSGRKAPESTYIDYNEDISLTVNNLGAYNSKYAVNGSSDALFTDPSFTYKSNNGHTINGYAEKIKNKLNSYQGIDSSTLKQLAAIYNPNKSDSWNEKAIQAAARGESYEGKKYSLYDPNNKYVNYHNGDNNVTLEMIKQYKEYSSFKSSKFEACGDTPTFYPNGQIETITLKFVE